MSYDIIVRFPTKEVADEFCGQMSDGFGEGLCDFKGSERIPGTDGTKNSHYRRVEDKGMPVYFVDRIFEF